MEQSEELNIGRYIRLLYKKRYLFVSVMVLVTSLVIGFGYVLPRKYEATSTVLIEKNFLNQVLKGITVSPSIDDHVKAVSAIMKSRPLVLTVMRDLDLDLTGKTEAETEKLVRTFQENTIVNVVINKLTRRDMDLFSVSLKHKDPVIARNYVNTLVRRYIEASVSANREDTYGANRFLTQQVELFKDKIKAIDVEIAKLTGSEIASPAAANATATQVRATNTQMRLLLLQKKMDDLLLNYTPNHPEVEKTRAEIELLTSQMQGLGKGREVTAGRSAALAEVQAALTRNVKKAGESGAHTRPDTAATHGGGVSPLSPVDSRKLAELERDRETYQKIYQDMLAAQGKAEVSTQIEVQDKGGSLRIIEPAVLPLLAASPDRIKIILLGLLAGIGAGIGLVILLDSTDKSIKNLETVNVFGLPVLAIIPHIQVQKEIDSRKRKDLLLYLISTVYLLSIAAILTYELHLRELI